MPFPFVDGASYPIRTTQDLRFHIDGEAAFSAIADAIEQARSYVYITVAYGSLDFRLRPPGGQFQDLLLRAAARGVRTAVLFWLPTGTVADTVPESAGPGLAAGGVMALWDRAKCSGIYRPFPELACHHQKTFVIDGETAFVGGINAVQSYWDTQAHPPGDDRRLSYDLTDPAQRAAKAASVLPLHDLFASFTGPAVSDVEANFVQRWNGTLAPGDPRALTVHAPAPAPAAGTPLQIVRTIAPDTYRDLPQGETSIRSAMVGLINQARSSIYFENQYFFDDDVVAALRAAGERGVRVVGLLCRAPDQGQAVGVLEKFLDEASEARLQWARFNPALSQRIQLYSPVTATARSEDIYVHSKTLIVDDQNVLAGSANVSFTSLDFHSEMCVLVQDAQAAASLRNSLWGEHLCLAGDQQLPAEFETAANLWQSAARTNAALRARNQAPESRVIPIHPFP